MSTLSIKDLNTVEELAADEAAKISGGFLLTGLLVVGGLIAVGAKEGVFDAIPVSDILKHQS